MEDLTKEPDSKHRMLMVSHTPQVPPKAVFVSKSCPDFVTECDDMSSVSSLQYMKCLSCSLPSQLNVAAKEVRSRTGYIDKGIQVILLTYSYELIHRCLSFVSVIWLNN